MAKTWRGTFGADWFAADAWSPSGVPVDGEPVTIDASGPTLSFGDLEPIGGHAVALGSEIFISQASITSRGYALGSGFDILVGDAAPFASLGFGAYYDQNGTLEANTAFDGRIGVSNAILNLNCAISNLPASVMASAAPVLQGSGTTTIARGGMVVVTGAVAATQTVSFADANGTLMLNDPADFAASITGLQTGDRIELGHLQVATGVAYDASASTLTIFGQGGSVLGALDVQGSGGPLQFYTMPFGHGGSAITTSQVTRNWTGAAGDWYGAGNWQSGVPLGGDTAAIGSGIVIITAADVVRYGALDFETVVLGNPGGDAPVALETTDATFGEGLTLITAGTAQYAPSYIGPQATFQANGLTRFEGMILDQAHGGTLTISVGAGGAFNLVGTSPTGPEDSGNFASVLVGQESRLMVQGGLFTDNGLILVDGAARFAADSTLQGYGLVQMEGGGSVWVDGAVSATNTDRPTFQFADSLGTLTLANLASFQGQVQVAEAGDRIDLPNIQVSSLSYTSVQGSTFGTLTLTGANGVSVGQLLVNDPNPAGASTADFTLGPDSGGGSLITYTPQGPKTLLEALPVPAVGTTGQVIPFATLLTGAFGGVPAGYSSYALSGEFGMFADESYWDQPPTGTPANSYWLLNGDVVTKDTTISADQIDEVEFVEGNSILRAAYFTVPTAVSASGAATEYTQYNMWTVDPSVNAPQTGYSTPDPNVPGSGSRFGAPDPSDIVASAYRYNSVYDQPYNTNNCNSISDNVTAGAGAVQPYVNYSTDPSQNQEAGFWRIVYRGSDTPNPVQNWFSLVQPGDVVRMGRLAQSGEHTTTIVGTVNPDGSIAVYDNGDHNSAGASVIGVHDATYWTGTDPNTITIYRLDPFHQYLITGTGQSEILQGSVFNNLIQAGGGLDTVTGGTGDNEIQDTTAHLNGITVTDWHLGDTLDFTDLSPAQAGVAFDADSGTLTVTAGDRSVAQLALLGVRGRPFFTASDSAGGTIVTSTPFDLGQYSDAATSVIATRFAPLAHTGKTTKITAAPDLSTLAAATEGQYNIAQLTAPAQDSTVALPAGYDAVILQGTAPVTLSDPGHGDAVLVANAGNDVLLANGPNDMLVANGGNDLLFGDPDGSVLVAGSGIDTLVAGAGDATMIGGAGQTLAFGGSGTLSFLGGSGAVTVVAGTGAADVSGGMGPMTVWGGSGGGAFFGGAAGNNVLVAGDGATTIGGGGSGDLLVGARTGNDVLIAGSDNVTLTGAGSSGDNLYFGGPGSNLIVAGGGIDTVVAGSGATTVFGGSGQTAIFAGSGSDVIVAGAGGGYIGAGGGNSTTWIGSEAGAELIGFVNGRGGGNDQVFGFRNGMDHLHLTNFAPGEAETAVDRAVVTGGATVLTLSDNTRVTLIGVTDLGGSGFV
jgi:Ca2+-binding RTX toxin-like protein